MSATRPQQNSRDLLLAILSGVLLTLSFPPGNFSFAAWFALVPLLKGIQNSSLSHAFKLGVVSGLAHYLTLIYWIIIVLKHYGNLHVVIALLCLLLLSLYLSLYLGLFASLTSRLADSRLVPVIAACYWVALEYLKSYIITGFPWCLMGYTQYEHLHIIQVADRVGVYGITFLIVLINGLIYRLISLHPGRWRDVVKWELPVPLLLLTGAWVYGHVHLSGIKDEEQTGRAVKAAIVQANIDQSEKWNPAYQGKTIQTYCRLTRSAESFGPELVVWPETALPFFFQDNPKFTPGIFSLADESGAILVFGSPAYRRHKGAVRYFNRAYMIAPGSRHVAYYDKNHLVPFGEYVPLKKYLPFVNRLVAAAGDFKAGDEIKPLKAEDLSLGVLICFEAIFPELAGTLAKEGANILVNITNDAWFGRSSAPYQHLTMAAFRCVETRRPMIRAANTGFSAFIDPTGQIRSRSELFSESVLKGSVPLNPLPLTFYSRYGDLFALALLILSCAHVAYSFVTKRLRTAV